MPEKQTTKERLRQAACDIFAAKGYHDATVAEICEAAGANIAAVNYHFGGKEPLYDEVWRHAFAVATKAHPIDGTLPENPSLEDHLHSFALAILHRIFSADETGRFAKLLYREMASPTLALDRIAAEALLPQTRFLGEAIRPWLGKPIKKQELQLCLNSIIGQCVFYNFSRPLRERVMGKKSISEKEIDRIARHIARFSLGGLSAIKEPT